MEIGCDHRDDISYGPFQTQ